MNLKKIALSVLATAALSSSLVACSTSPDSLATDSTPEPVPTHSTTSPAPKATAIPSKAPKAPKDQTTTANVPMTESVSAPPVQIIESSPETINPPVMPATPAAPTAPPLDTVTNQHVQTETVQNNGDEVSNQNGLSTNEDTATTETEYLEAIFDENQSTHWENGGLVVSTLGDALAMCGDPRFGPESDFSDCVNASNEWAKDAGLDTDKVGPTTLPPAPAPVK